MESRFQKTWWWTLVGVLLLGLVALAVVLNTNFNTTTKDSDGINIDNGDTKIDWGNYPTYDVELTGAYNITAPGTYHLTGSSNDGGISVRVADNVVVRLILDNVSIANPSGPAIACFSGDDLVIELIGENYLEDGTKYNSSYDNDVSGAIYSKADLTFKGEGLLAVKANYEDGIVSKDDLKFAGGTYNISANDDGIRGKDSVYIVDGKFEINAKGDGIKSTNDTDTSKGFVLIAGGDIDIAKSYEGLEARLVVVDDGKVSIFANDDGINAGETVQINGGEIYVNAAGDGIDSNGYLYFNGGKTAVDGPTNSGNGALDAEYQIVQNGGEVVAVGASGMAESLGNASAIYNVNIYFTSTLPKDTKVTILDANGDTIISHTSAKTFSHMAAGTNKFKAGETYYIYVDGGVYQSFTISDITTTVGNGGYNVPGGPGGNTGGNGPQNMGPPGRR